MCERLSEARWTNVHSRRYRIKASGNTLALALGPLVLLQASVAAAVGSLEVRHHPIQELALADLAVTVGVGGGELLDSQNLGNFVRVQAAVLVLVQTSEGRRHEGLIFRSVDRSILVTIEPVHLALVHSYRLILRIGRNGGKENEPRQQDYSFHNSDLSRQ